jgi:Anti-sigma factor NepR
MTVDPEDRRASLDEQGAGGKEQPGEGEVAIDERALKAIGDALQAHYNAIAMEPLPARFLVMLAELEAKERRNES